MSELERDSDDGAVESDHVDDEPGEDQDEDDKGMPRYARLPEKNGADATIDEADLESFPASDPPPY